MGNVEKRFRELLNRGPNMGVIDEKATLRDLIDLAAIVDDELAKLPIWKDARKLVDDYGHTERRE